MGIWNRISKSFGFGRNEAPPNNLREAISKGHYDDDTYERFDDGNYGFVGPSTINPGNDLKDFLGLYLAHPWVYACANTIATAAAGVEYQFLKNGKEEIKDHPIIDIFKKPNPHQVWYEFQETIWLYLELCGNAFIEEVRDEKGILRGFYPLRPDKMKIIPHPKYKVAGYIYEPNTGRQIALDAQEVVHIKNVNPLDEYWGVSPGFAAQNSLILDMWATSYNKKFFKNSAVPEGVLETEGTLSDQAYRRLRADWMRRHRGVDNAFELAILEEGLHYKPISFNQRDMQMAELKALSREEILAAWRVPPVMVGLLEHSNFATSREQKKMFWMDNVIPKLTKQQGIINANMMPPDIALQYVTKAIWSIIEDNQVSSQISTSLVSHGIMTINEVREKYHGYKPVEWGNKWWAPVGLAPVDSGVHPETPKANQMTQPERSATQSPEEAQNQSTPMKRDIFEKEEFAKNEPEPNWDDPVAVRYWQVRDVWKRQAESDYYDLKKIFKQFFKEQFDRLTSAWPVLYPTPSEPKSVEKNLVKEIIKDLYENPYAIGKAKFDPIVERMLFSVTKEDKKLRIKLEPKSKAIVKKHGQVKLGSIKIQAPFSMRNERVEKFLEKFGGANIGGINKTTRELMGRSLSKSIENGEDYKDAINRIREVMTGDLSENRARAIARTELVTLTQFASLEAARQSGVIKKKQWISEKIPTTRHSHEEMHGMAIPLEDKFIVQSRSGFDEMDGPGDQIAKAENLVNCICVLDFPAETEEYKDLNVPEEEQPNAE